MSLGALVVLEHKLPGAGGVEARRHLSTARLIAGEGECLAFDPVYAVARFANVLGQGTFGNRGDNLLRVRIFSKRERSFVPFICVPTTELQVLAGDNETAKAPGLGTYFRALPRALQSGRI